jgi:molecular chaperone DnaK
VEFYFELRKQDVEKVAEPFIVRSLNICKQVLSERRLGAHDLEKVLLVGGPTLMPYLRERLAGRVEGGLGLDLEYSIDPLTVVARGAAVFAGTQRLEGLGQARAKAGEYSVELDYQPVGSDAEPMVGGRVSAANGAAFPGFTIEFVNTAARPQWRSGKIGLAPDGAFVTQLYAQKGLMNTFDIQLCDGAGTALTAVPSSFTYTIGIVMTDPPLIHSVGVALANNEVELFLEKGSPLPARKRITLRTAIGVRRGEADVLHVPVIEGENTRRADRNRLIGALAVPGKELRRDVPAGSEVEVTIEIDSSRLVKTKAYIPILDQDFEDVLPLEKKRAGQDELQTAVKREEARLEEARKKASATGDRKAKETIQRIDRERMVHEIDVSLEAAPNDGDAADKCNSRLTDLKVAIDEVDDALEWPGLVAAAEKEIADSNTIISQYGKNPDKQAMTTLEREIRKAIEVREPDLLRRKTSELSSLRFRVLREQPGWWVSWIDELEKMKTQMTNRADAEQWIAQGRRAINNNDVQALKTAVQQLFALLPPVQRQEMESGFNSGLHRGAGA